MLPATRSSSTAASRFRAIRTLALNFEHRDTVKDSRAKVGAFMAQHVYPVEQVCHDFVHDPVNRWQEWPGMEALERYVSVHER